MQRHLYSCCQKFRRKRISVKSYDVVLVALKISCISCISWTCILPRSQFGDRKQFLFFLDKNLPQFTKMCMIRSLLRACVLALAIHLTVTFPANAEDDYHIASIRNCLSNDLIEVNGVYRKDLKMRVLVALRVAQDTPGKSVFVKAYFYDKDNLLVASYSKPNKIWTNTTKGFESIDIPEIISLVRQNFVYFALPGDLQAKKWKTILIVFGDATHATAESQPPSIYPKLDYPEKSLVEKRF